MYLHSIHCGNHCRVFDIISMRSTARRDMQVLPCISSSQSRLIMAWMDLPLGTVSVGHVQQIFANAHKTTHLYRLGGHECNAFSRYLKGGI